MVGTFSQTHGAMQQFGKMEEIVGIFLKIQTHIIQQALACYKETVIKKKISNQGTPNLTVFLSKSAVLPLTANKMNQCKSGVEHIEEGAGADVLV
jgi:hypothetical protein